MWRIMLSVAQELEAWALIKEITMLAKCKICGHEEHQLFTHLKKKHRLSPGSYQQEHPEAELLSVRLSNYLARHDDIVATENGLKRSVSLFGIDLLIPLVPNEFVPPVDPGFLFEPKLAAQILISLRDAEKILLVGPTGCGKSSLVEQLAAHLNWPLIRVAASGGLTESDLVGEWVVRNGETVFNYGFLPRAMKMGAICLIDEIDGIEPSVAFAIHQVMEDRGRLVLLQNGGEVVEPHENFRLVTTANTLGDGDDAGLYTGTRVLNAGFLDRFASIFRMSYLPEVEEVAVLQARVPSYSPQLAHKLVSVASEIRAGYKQHTINYTFSTRRLIDLARKHEQLGDFSMALQLAVLNRLSQESSQVVFEVCQRVLGYTLVGEINTRLGG